MSGPTLAVTDYAYVWAWSARPAGRKGQRCRVVCRGAMNSALVEFEDRALFVTSRNGIRRAPANGHVLDHLDHPDNWSELAREILARETR